MTGSVGNGKSAAAASSPRARRLRSARSIVDTVPRLMRAVRGEMRAAALPGLSIPQFRILIHVRQQPGASVTALAEHLGVTAPTASVAVERLVRQALLRTEAVLGDRRRVALFVTDAGDAAVRNAMTHTAESFAQRLGTLSAAQLDQLDEALGWLAAAFAPLQATAASQE
ncbi:MAG TPA: MarR family winged helix-turn-helix transcriptional regulator [Burkholderiaceae bacterium]|nr:MarR family winged helix-turn-helix transcriptional regulator [Burkholderiaceae bacterium]